MHAAVRRGDAESVALLLEAGADPMKRELQAARWSPLDLALISSTPNLLSEPFLRAQTMSGGGPSSSLANRFSDRDAQVAYLF